MQFNRPQYTLYEQLKVTADAPQEVVRAAYRALAALHHPDRVDSTVASHDHMAAINAAYEVLIDADRRADYDKQLALSSGRQLTSPEESGAGQVRSSAHRTRSAFARPVAIDAANASATAVHRPRSLRIHRHDAWVMGVSLLLAIALALAVTRQRASTADADEVLTAPLRQQPPLSASVRASEPAWMIDAPAAGPESFALRSAVSSRAEPSGAETKIVNAASTPSHLK